MVPTYWRWKNTLKTQYFFTWVIVVRKVFLNFSDYAEKTFIHLERTVLSITFENWTQMSLSFFSQLCFFHCLARMLGSNPGEFVALQYMQYTFKIGLLSQTLYERSHCTLYRKSDLWFPETKLRGLVPNSYIHVSVSNLYIPVIDLNIWLQPNRQIDPGNI